MVEDRTLKRGQLIFTLQGFVASKVSFYQWSTNRVDLLDPFKAERKAMAALTSLGVDVEAALDYGISIIYSECLAF